MCFKIEPEFHEVLFRQTTLIRIWFTICPWHVEMTIHQDDKGQVGMDSRSQIVPEFKQFCKQSQSSKSPICSLTSIICSNYRILLLINFSNFVFLGIYLGRVSSLCVYNHAQNVVASNQDAGGSHEE